MAFVRRADAIAGGYMYAELPHPDFADCPTRRRETRVPKVADALREHDVRSAVDLGCCTGSFACDLAAVVPRVHGVERDPAFVELARWRARRSGNAATFEVGDLVEWTGEADLFSTLSVLHHVVMAHGVDALNAWMRGTQERCRYLLVEYPAANEPILSRGGPARDIANDLPAWLAAVGFAVVRDFGIDEGFGKDVMGRRLLLAAGATIRP